MQDWLILDLGDSPRDVGSSQFSVLVAEWLPVASGIIAGL